MTAYDYSLAAQDFRRARRKADLEAIMAPMKGKSAELLSFEDVKKTLKITGSAAKGVQEIPLDHIVGSVGRYKDFTRNFLPKQDEDGARWSGVQSVVTGMVGAPPIEVYKIDQVYFVIDGNHRVSIAQQFEAKTIEAYVTELRTPISLSPDTQPDDLIIKAEYKEFLEHTRLDELRPGMDLTVTAPGKYRFFEEQIARHYLRLEEAQKRELALDEVVMDWYDTIYLPTARIIQERGILRDFPDRTVTDAYVWLLQYRKDVERQLGWRINQEKSAIELVRQHSPTSERMFSRLGEKLYDALTPTELGEGPAPGKWRKEILALRRDDRLFTNILVPLSGDEESWCALEQAVEIARVEEGYLHGLHIVPSESQRESNKALAVKVEFEKRCQAAGIPGNLLIEIGDIPRKICDLARWTDLIVLHLVNPPGKRAISRLKSSFRPIIRRSPRPILAVPTMATTLDRALLAYDGSPKANEALFLSAYIARRPESSLTVVCVEDERVTPETLDFARGYLHRQGVQAAFVKKPGPVGETILQTAQEHHSNLIIMGGYGHSPAVELVLGSKIDKVLRRSQQPMLICR